MLAILHYNENLRREKKKTNAGQTYLNVTFAKFKNGADVVREVTVEATYGIL